MSTEILNHLPHRIESIYTKTEEMEKEIKEKIKSIVLKEKKKKLLNKDKNSYYDNKELAKYIKLEDDLLFIQSIEDDDSDMFKDQKVMYDKQKEIDLTFPVDLSDIDGSCIPLYQLFEYHPMLFKFLYYRQTEGDPIFAENYVEYTEFINKIQIKTEKVPVFRLLMDIDHHVVSCGETKIEEHRRKNKIQKILKK